MVRSLASVCAVVAGLSAAAAAAEPAEEAEPALAVSGSEGEYLKQLHARVHTRWADSFLAMAAAQLPKTHALNDPGLRVVLHVTLTRAGALAKVNVSEPSGVMDFDAAAVEVLKDSLPLPGVPEAALSDDDQAHFVWAFARDHRRCSDAKPVDVESPLEEALPRLLAKKREGEALRRARAAAATAPARAASLFATAWCKQALGTPALAPRAAAALLAAGDRTVEPHVRDAVMGGDTAEPLAVALAHAKLPVCEQVKDGLGKTGSREQAAAVAALRFTGETACAPDLAAVARDRGLPAAVRRDAIEALGAMAGDPKAKKALGELEKDGPTALRAAALLAGAAPGGGRAALFRLTPFLRDPALDMRVAAIAGLLRAVGESSLDQLYLLWNEKDPRPYEAAAAGLGRLGSEASAGLLGRMLRKDDRRVRVAAAAALAARSDEHARKALEQARKDADPEVRVFAAALMDDAERKETVGRLSAGEGARLFRGLAEGSGRNAAAEWLLGTLTRADASTKVDLLATWLLAAGGAGGVATAR